MKKVKEPFKKRAVLFFLFTIHKKSYSLIHFFTIH